MTQKESKQAQVEKHWFFVRFYKWSGKKIKNSVAWLFPGKQVFPANETGELIRRTLANKSWFDTISSTWVHLSFWKQFLAVAGVTLVAGLVGLLAGASVLFLCSALFLSIACHVLFVAHENHRTKSAKTSVAEQLELQKNLEQGKELLAEVVQAINPVAGVLEEEATRLKVQADAMTEVVVSVKEHADEIDVATREFSATVDAFDAKGQEILAEKDSVIGGLRDAGVALDAASQRIDSIGEAAVTLNEAARDFQQSQREYSAAVGRFGLFVSEQLKGRPKRALDEIVTLPDEYDEFGAHVDSIIEQIKEGKMVVSCAANSGKILSGVEGVGSFSPNRSPL